MEVSLYHRLAGAWLAVLSARQGFAELSESGLDAQLLWRRLVETGSFAEVQISLPECSLRRAFGLLPVLLFYHEDPIYLGDRLDRLGAGDRLSVELGNVVSACLRERLNIEGLPRWFADHSQLSSEGKKAFHTAFLTEHSTWKQWRGQVWALPISPAEQQILLIYSALVWGKGQGTQCGALVAAESAIVQAWVWVLLGCIRGDRQSPNSPQIDKTAQQIAHQEIRQFWSQWSGLPAKNQLQLGQLPVIASCQVLQTRTTPSLLSQRHLT